MNTPVKQRFRKTGGDAGKVAPLKGMLKQPPKELRLQLGLTQADFWLPVGVSQSGGSRYESGRKLPAAISALLHLVHIQGVLINELVGADRRVGLALKEADPVRYEALLKSRVKG
jgi:DNA-binding transcriptional regulator YiaG